MEWGIKDTEKGPADIASANHPGIRLFVVPKSLSSKPLKELPGTNLKWRVCNPQNILIGTHSDDKTSQPQGFSGTAYYFGRELYTKLEKKVPIGLIQSAWGGSRIEPWTAPEGFADEPALKNLNVNAGQHHSPTAIFDAMIKPIVPCAIKGVIWYQGESHVGEEDRLYPIKMKALINGWRKLWGQGDFPFYYVQLAPFEYGGTKLVEFWENQMKSLSLKNTGMAIINDTIDVNEQKDHGKHWSERIHPKNKEDVGLRLAYLTLAKDYGLDIVASGPIFKKYVTSGNTIRIIFEHTGRGLKWRDKNSSNHSFQISNDGSRFVKANARIDGHTVILSGISNPRYVKFAWSNIPTVNLVNSSGLPASSFRALP